MTTNRFKTALKTFLETRKPDDSITIADGKDFRQIALPAIVADVPSAEAHSATLVGVLRCQVEITLRAASGDHEQSEIETWVDALETVLNDPSLLKAELSGSQSGVRVDYWEYQGATNEWNETTLETTFSALALMQRILPATV